MSSFVADHAIRRPDAIALQDAETGATISWAQLESEVATTAAALTGHYGLRNGDRVAYLAADTVHTFVALLAGQRAGTIFVPLNRRLSAPELEALVKDSEPVLLVHDGEWADTAAGLSAATGVRLTTVDDLARAAAAAVPADGWPVGHPFAPDDPIMLLYTSGTTGLPKGAIISEAMVAAHLVNVLDSMGAAAADGRYLSVLPLFHAAGLLAISMPTLIRGGTIVVGRRFDAVATAALLSDPAQGITTMNGAPIMYQMIAEVAGPGASFAHVRHGMVGGGRLPEDVYEYYAERGLLLQVGWGATEMGPSTTIMPVGRAGAGERSVGRMVPLARLRVVGEDGVDVGPGEVGEAWLSGPSISPGYWRRPLAEDDTRVDGWYRCGDAVSVAPDGHVDFHGRFKDMYKSGGENVFNAEVEHVLLDYPGIAEAAVIGVPHRKWGEAGRALIVPDAGVEIDKAALLIHCRERLAGYKVPADVVFCTELPRNVTGKVAKLELQQTHGHPIEF